MATLVQFLAAGVNGAASGTATFLLRGTASSAASVLYNDFEGTTQPGTNIIALDANGAAEVYCDAYVDVVLKSSAGSTHRTVTVGNSAPTVEVQSTSFTGTDYDGSPSNTIGEPITLKAILDKWITSAGASNWQILFNGVATNIQTALAGLAGIFINVKDPTYGAAGDGVTNDTTAILAAMTAASAAGGGIVFFPPGTYQVTTMSPSVRNVVLMGCGHTASIIRGTSATVTLLKFTDHTAASIKRITGLGFTSTTSYQALIDVEQNQTLNIDNCKFTCTNASAAAIRRADVDGATNVSISECLFEGIAGTSAVQNLSDEGESLFTITACRFVVNAGFTGAIIAGPNFCVSECEFNAAAVTSGIYHHIDAESTETSGRYLGTFTGNTFIDGGSAGFAFDLTNVGTNSVFTEDANVFVGFTAPTAFSDPGHIYDYSNGGAYDVTSLIHLGSRRGKQLNFTNSTDTSVGPFECFLIADTIVVDHTNPANVAFFDQPAEKPLGLTWNMVILNNSGGTRTIQFNGGGTGKIETIASVIDGSMAFGSLFTFLEVAGTVRSAIVAAN
jgi:pectate lyase-like protein